MTEQGDQESYDVDFSADQQAMQEASAQYTQGQAFNAMPIGPPVGTAMQAQAMANMADAKGRMEKKAELASAVSSGASMRVDPDQVDKLANFFEDEAEALRKQSRDVHELLSFAPPGTDPTSKAATKVYREVGIGDDQAYYDNVMKLADLFDDTAANLRGNAQQTRSDDLGAEEAMGKAGRA